jgi:hypothetical protein
MTVHSNFYLGKLPESAGEARFLNHGHPPEKSLALIGNASGQGAEVAGIAPRHFR